MKPTTNRESCTAVHVKDSAAGFEHGPGAWWFEDHGGAFCLMALLPGMHLARCPIDGSRGWTFNGLIDCPDMNPSILVSMTIPSPIPETIELWHGYLRQGRFESV